MHSLSRRSFLARSGAAGAGVVAGSMTPFSVLAAEALAATERPGDVLVVVSLRGGADGLNLVAPVDDAAYVAARPTTRVLDPSVPGAGSAAGLPLAGTRFALHPALARLHRTAWADGHLAIVHATGLPAAEISTRSHFEAMRVWENGTASTAVGDGYLNRCLGALAASSPLAGIGRGASLPWSLTGERAAVSLASIGEFGVGGFGDPTAATAVLTDWYGDASGSGSLASAGAAALAAAAAVRSVDWGDTRFAVRNGAEYPATEFGTALCETAKLVRAQLGQRIVCIDLPGWDTHAAAGRPGDPDSVFHRQCAALSDGLAAFSTDLGDLMAGVTVVTATEFGRTIRENGTGGTDHGRGTAMLVLGHGVRGGVYGPFPDSVTDGPDGDLAVLTDSRHVLAEVMTRRCGVADVSTIFPGLGSVVPLGLCR